MPATTPDYVIVDHQLHHETIEASGLVEHLRASWDLTPDLFMYIEAVHRLTDLGVVVTLAVHGISTEGFDAEWRIVELLTREGDLGKRCEIFKEADLDAALATFDELNRPAPRLENAASQVAEHFWMHFAANDRALVSDIMAVDISIEDRRPVVNSGLRQGRDAVIDDMQLRADSGVRQTTPSVIATRGAHLVLGRIGYTAEDERPDPFVIEILFIIEIDVGGAVLALVVFDPDAIDTAFEELDSRYAAGEAAPMRTRGPSSFRHSPRLIDTSSSRRTGPSSITGDVAPSRPAFLPHPCMPCGTSRRTSKSIWTPCIDLAIRERSSQIRRTGLRPKALTPSGR